MLPNGYLGGVNVASQFSQHGGLFVFKHVNWLYIL